MQHYLIQSHKTHKYISIKKDARMDKGKTVISKGNRQYQKAGLPSKKGGTDLLATVAHYLKNDHFEICVKRAAPGSGLLLLFLIDSSGSMIKGQQIGYIKGLIEQTVALHSSKKIQYGAISLSQAEAAVISPFTKQQADLLASIAQMPSGGKTNMKAGFEVVSKMVEAHLFPHLKLYIFTDGKINAGAVAEPFEAAVSYYKTYLKSICETTVLGSEEAFIQLGLSEKFARQIGAKYTQL